VLYQPLRSNSKRQHNSRKLTPVHLLTKLSTFYGTWKFTVSWAREILSLGYDTGLMGNWIATFRGLLILEDDDSTLPQKVGIWLPINAASYPTKTECSATLLPKPQNQRWILFKHSHPSSLRSILQYRVTTKWHYWQSSISL